MKIGPNNTKWLTAIERGPRLRKRSVDIQNYYLSDDDLTDLETADNVVFERLRRDVENADDDGGKLSEEIRSDVKYGLGYNLENNEINEARSPYDIETNRVKRETPLDPEDGIIEDLEYKQFIEETEARNPSAQVVDLKSLERRNRPADVLEYKRFLKVTIETI